MSTDTIVTLLAGYTVVALGMSALWAHGEIEIEEVALWPLALAKWLLKALFRVLFTGWRS